MTHLLSLAFAFTMAFMTALVEDPTAIGAAVVLGVMLHIAAIDLGGFVHHYELYLNLRLRLDLANVLRLRDAAKRHTRQSRNHNLLHHLIHFRFPFCCLERSVAFYIKQGKVAAKI